MIRNPIFIVGCPRSGTSLLYNVLAENPDLWSIGYESKEIIEKYHHPSMKNWVSGALDTDDVTDVSKDYILTQFEIQSASGVFWRAVNRIRNLLRKMRISLVIKNRGKSKGLDAEFSGLLPQRGLNLIRSYVKMRNTILPSIIPEEIRFLEKTPENCLRLPFLLELFPDAKIIYLVRDGRANIYSLMEGWRQPYIFPGYKVPEQIRIPGDQRGRWAFTLIPGWRNLLDRPLEEVCAWQWVRCNQAVMDFFETQGRDVPCLQINYELLISEPIQVLGNIMEYAGISKRYLTPVRGLPKINIVSAPDPQKWRKMQDEIEGIFPIIKPVMDKLGYK